MSTQIVQTLTAPNETTIHIYEADDQSTLQSEENICKGDTQMKNDNNNTVPVITTADFDDIKERAESIEKVFGSSKKDALRAAVTLKAQEINRDLSPLMDLLA